MLYRVGRQPFAAIPRRIFVGMGMPTYFVVVGIGMPTYVQIFLNALLA